MEQQLESHDRVNYKVIELKITFVLISSSAKQGSNREVITRIGEEENYRYAGKQQVHR